MNKAIGFEGDEASVLRILKSLAFKYARCSDGRKVLVEHSDVVVVRLVFLRTMHEIRQVVVVNCTT
jgi:hypothetical protein